MRGDLLLEELNRQREINIRSEDVLKELVTRCRDLEFQIEQMNSVKELEEIESFSIFKLNLMVTFFEMAKEVHKRFNSLMEKYKMAAQAVLILKKENDILKKQNEIKFWE